MGKRSEFERLPRNAYYTPYAAVVPLLPHLPPNTYYDEPCAGNGALIRHLGQHGHVCRRAGDTDPASPFFESDAMFLTKCSGEMFITNPPWTRDILHPMIEHLSSIAPTWFLFDADWAHTKQSSELMKRCRKIVSIGRVKWIEGSKMTGKDNCCWYFFDRPNGSATVFVGR